MSKIFCLDGIIGSGKSSIVRCLEKKKKYEVIQEPFESNVFLQDFYKDPRRWSFSAQIDFLTERLRQFWYSRYHPAETLIIERSVYSDCYCFAEMLLDDGYMQEHEFKAYKKYFEVLANLGSQPDVCIVIFEKPETALQRITERGREMEKDITLGYLRSLERKHVDNITKLGKKVYAMVAGDYSFLSVQLAGEDVVVMGLPETIEERVELVEYVLSLPTNKRKKNVNLFNQEYEKKGVVVAT